MTAPFPAALVEAVALALADGRTAGLDGTPRAERGMRKRALAALSALPAAVQAVARGEAVAVPWPPSAMPAAMSYVAGSRQPGMWSAGYRDDVLGYTLPAMLAASPYAQEPRR